jgi:hypothetical protein
MTTTDAPRVSELKPCPLCNYHYGTSCLSGTQSYSVLCERCELQTGPYASKELAAEAWNQRASSLGLEEREALHGGAQALSMTAHDMEQRKIDKTEALRNYAAILRKLAERK